MNDYLKCKLEALPPQQQRLWPELKGTPVYFVLYGGTALSLRLGHRVSVDFDFFSNKPFDSEQLYEQVPYLRQSRVQQMGPNTLTCLVDRDGPVQVSFFGGLDLGCAVYPSKAVGNSVLVASMLDVAAAKAKVIIARPVWKDYVDMDAVMQHGLDLTRILSAAQSLYKPPFSPLLSLKALSFFEDIGEGLNSEVKNRLLESVKNVNIEKIKTIHIKKELTQGMGKGLSL